MRIFVYDVAAENGGALTVLYDFYDEFKIDLSNDYIFVLSLPLLKETDNIKVLNFPWIKKSWIHRIYFDYLIAPKLIKKYKVDKVFSLQNTLVPHTDIYQSVFVHNALPFTNYRIKITQDIKLWIYQNIIGSLIKNAIIKADKVIVQTKWMQDSCAELLSANIDKIEVRKTKIDIQVRKYFENTQENYSTFFFPASGVIFKNHKVIIDACSILKNEYIGDYKVIFTLIGNESIYIKKLFDFVQKNNLPIEFIGPISREVVFDYYSKSILLFPSYIETVGLPLLEASIHNTPIITADLTYSHDILNEYKETRYFCPFDSNQLSIEMKNFLNK